MRRRRWIYAQIRRSCLQPFPNPDVLRRPVPTSPAFLNTQLYMTLYHSRAAGLECAPKLTVYVTGRLRAPASRSGQLSTYPHMHCLIVDSKNTSQNSPSQVKICNTSNLGTRKKEFRKHVTKEPTVEEGNHQEGGVVNAPKDRGYLHMECEVGPCQQRFKPVRLSFT